MNRLWYALVMVALASAAAWVASWPLSDQAQGPDDEDSQEARVLTVEVTRHGIWQLAPPESEPVRIIASAR